MITQEKINHLMQENKKMGDYARGWDAILVEIYHAIVTNRDLDMFLTGMEDVIQEVRFEIERAASSEDLGEE